MKDGLHKLAKISWLFAALGATAMVAPRLHGVFNDEGRGYWWIGFGAGAVLLSAILKEWDLWDNKRGQDLELVRVGHKIGELITAVAGFMIQASPSVNRTLEVVAAVQRCTLRLVPAASDGNLRVCVYQLEYDEERQAPGSTPGIRPVEEAHLVLVGHPQGRGLDPARQQFDYDEEGRDTLGKIVRNKHVWCSDTKKRPTMGLETGRSYASYLSVPIWVNGKVEGMLTCDSTVKSDLSEKLVPILRMTAVVAGIGLSQNRLSKNSETSGEQQNSTEPEVPKMFVDEVR